MVSLVLAVAAAAASRSKRRKQKQQQQSHAVSKSMENASYCKHFRFRNIIGVDKVAALLQHNAPQNPVAIESTLVLTQVFFTAVGLPSLLCACFDGLGLLK